MDELVKWEYTRAEIATDYEWSNPIEELNEYGDDGWELVSSNFIKGSYRSTMMCVFKRVKQPVAPEQPLPQPPRNER